MSHAHPLGVHLFECVCSHKPASEEIILDIRSEYMCMCGFDVISDGSSQLQDPNLLCPR